MKTGRKPKPTALRVLEGNRGKRKMPVAEPCGVRDLAPGDAPAWLDAGGRQVWDRELARAPRGLLAVHQAELVAAYCATLHEMARAGELLSASTPIIKMAGNQYAVSPPMTAFSRHAELARKLASELGLTPTSSPRATARPAEDSGNPFARLKRGPA